MHPRAAEEDHVDGFAGLSGGYDGRRGGIDPALEVRSEPFELPGGVLLVFFLALPAPLLVVGSRP